MKRQEPDQEPHVSEVCRVCHKPIAAALWTEALCCECRYGPEAWKDKGERVLDCVEHMHKTAGERLASGFRRIKRHED